RRVLRADGTVWLLQRSPSSTTRVTGALSPSHAARIQIASTEPEFYDSGDLAWRDAKDVQNPRTRASTEPEFYDSGDAHAISNSSNAFWSLQRSPSSTTRVTPFTQQIYGIYRWLQRSPSSTTRVTCTNPSLAKGAPRRLQRSPSSTTPVT